MNVMAQRPKEEMRRAILAAMAEELADVGFEKTTLLSVAARAGTSIGNLYKYFDDKQQLFEEAVPRAVASQLASLVRARVEALGVERDVRGLDDAHPYEVAAEELLRFALAHRAQVRFLLERASGTSYASFGDDLVDDLTKLALRYAARAYPSTKISASRRRALVRIYRGFLASLASVLREESGDRALREATAHVTTYHLAGLKALFEAAERS